MESHRRLPLSDEDVRLLGLAEHGHTYRPADASGDFHAIRRLMTDRPHSIMLRSSDDRRFASALIGQPAVFGVEIVDGHVMLRTSDLEAFALVAPRVAREQQVTIFEMAPTDESLESVFSYLVRR